MLNNTYDNYYKPENFYTNNTAYNKYKEKFDNALLAFKHSEEIKDKIKKFYTDEDIACILILAKSQNLYISILKLSNEGLAETAGILLRSLYENFVQINYITKYKLGAKFRNYMWISLKEDYDRLEKEIPKELIEDNKDYDERKKLVFKQFEKYKDSYSKRTRKLLKPKTWLKPRKTLFRNWSGISLFRMAKNIGEKSSYNTIMPYHSKFVHCDSKGLMNYAKGDIDNWIFENSASFKNIDLVLIASIEIYNRIVVKTLESLKIDIPEALNKYKNQPKLK